MSHGFEGDGASAVLARELGISVEDVEAYVSWEVNQGDDGHPYSILVTFDRTTPAETRVAAGAGDGFSVHLGLNIFDEEE